MEKQRGFTIAELVIAIIGLVCIGGWIANIVKLADMCCNLSGMLLIRAIGIPFAPLGMVMGFI